jgi:hypothetical protein
MGAFLNTLEELWKKGRLREVERDLDRFIHHHLGEIRLLLREGKAAGLNVARRRYTEGAITDRQLVDFCVRAVLRKSGSCNPRRDIEEQRHEIEKEVWYEGERLRGPVPPDLRERIARAWASRHALRWREWRLYELLYVWDKKADEYVGLITSK